MCMDENKVSADLRADAENALAAFTGAIAAFNATLPPEKRVPFDPTYIASELGLRLPEPAGC